MNKRIIVAITGSSGMLYSVHLLKLMIALPVELHLVISDTGWNVFRHETGTQNLTFREYVASLHHNEKNIAARITVHENRDLFASIASGSYKTDGMIIIPCSMKTLSAVAAGYADNLIQRAADVTLKERRPLILVVRETPLSIIHLKNMIRATEAGALIAPASPGLYNHPQTIDELAFFMAKRVLDQLDIEYPDNQEWKGQ